MIIPKIAHLLLRQPKPIIPLPPPPLLILKLQPRDETHHQQRRHDQQSQANREPRPIKRRLRSRENETRDDTPGVPQPDLQPRGDGGLVLATHVVRHHGPEQGEGNVRARFDEEEGGVRDAFGDVYLAKEDDEADETYQIPGLGERKTVL